MTRDEDVAKLISKINRSGAADLLRLRPQIVKALEESRGTTKSKVTQKKTAKKE